MNIPAAREHLSYADTKMIEAFGVPLLNSDGKPRTERFELIWERASQLSSHLYRLPGGSVGRKFVFLLANEIKLFKLCCSKIRKMLDDGTLNSPKRCQNSQIC
jgi:hypothetical protein